MIKEEEKKKSIAKIIGAYVRKHKLLPEGNDKVVLLRIIDEVKKVHPTMKIVTDREGGLDQVRWYISRYRRQQRKGKTTEHLVVMAPEKGKAKAAPARKHGAKAKRSHHKKAVKVTSKPVAAA